MSRPTKRVKPNPSSYPQPTTWSSTNLLATPSPTHDSITFTHFTGIQPARLTFLLPLPTRSSTSPNRRHIKRLSFGPDSGVLLAVVSGEGGDEEGDGERVIIWNMNDTIDAWSIVFDEPLEGLLAPGSGDGRKTEVVESRWLGEQRKWYPAPRPVENEGASTPTRPLFSAPLRSPPVLGLFRGVRS